MVEDSMEVFMDDFSVVGYSFEICLAHLGWVRQRCVETNLVLNWEKCHFMIKEGIVLGHKVSQKGLGVVKAKIEVIEKLPPPISVEGVRSFLGHASKTLNGAQRNYNVTEQELLAVVYAFDKFMAYCWAQRTISTSRRGDSAISTLLTFVVSRVISDAGIFSNVVRLLGDVPKKLGDPDFHRPLHSLVGSEFWKLR
ncbi:uncharacterized protein LOC125829385 [Solanum verrucosum]|uniref:uncharacterized protein LOC125829385 n=1 Tax=Solanum verrucosum TaxID=315347 RepID=UPI0020D01613|nr:uncharacterized protein LOC125829385 [Solanum verrucosum]